jgi:very-short-patch-repair endonuclease
MKRKPKKRLPSQADILLPIHMAELGLPLVTEWRFDEKRLWRFDFSNIPKKLALEIEGGIWTGGAHVRGEHFQSDLHKYSTATALGWTVFRFSTEDVLTGKAKEFVKMWLQNRPN